MLQNLRHNTTFYMAIWRTEKMKMKKILSLLLVALMVVALSACGGQKKNDADSNTGDVADNSTEPVSTPDGADPELTDLEYITANGKLVVGITIYEPMNYYDDNGNLTGFDTEFAQAVCERLGLEADFVEINWDTKEIELAAKSIDCIWNGMTITASREAAMSISLPYVKNAQVVVAKIGSGITSTADLIGKTVVAEVGSAGEVQIIGTDEDEPDENLAQSNYIAMGKQTDCLLEVKAGTADACVLDWTLAKSMVGEGTSYADLEMVEGLELASEEYGIAFRKGSDATAAIDEIIEEMVADGSLGELAEKYGLSLAPSLEK